MVCNVCEHQSCWLYASATNGPSLSQVSECGLGCGQFEGDLVQEGRRMLGSGGDGSWRQQNLIPVFQARLTPYLSWTCKIAEEPVGLRSPIGDQDAKVFLLNFHWPSDQCGCMAEGRG